MKMVLGIYYSPWEQLLERHRMRGRRVLSTYLGAVHFKANPRTLDYMKQEFFSRWPDGTLRIIEEKFPPDSALTDLVTTADTIVLLYPDATGLGFGVLERQIFKRKRPAAAVRVVNGRKREFLLNAAVLRMLRLRRFMEATMLGEVIATTIFLIATPALLIIDLVRRKT
jgi:hypothetical protein